MKKHLLKSFAVMVMACGSYAWAYADNVVYGLVGGEPAYSVSFDLDALNPDAATAITKGFSFDDVSEIRTGVTAGDKYYVFCNTTDEESGTSGKSLVTLNLTNGKMVVVNNFSYEYGQTGFYTSGMAYDDKNGKLYSMERMYEDGGYVTNLNLIDESKGTMTNVAKFDGEFNAIAADHEGGFYLLKNVAKGMQNYPNLYKVSADYTISEYLTNDAVSAFWPQSVNLTVSPDGKTAYAFEGSNVIALDLVAKTAEKKGSLTLDGSAANVMAITYGKGTADGVHNDPPVKKKEQTRFLVKEEYFGDYLGYVPSDIVGTRYYYYYNPDGKQVGSVRYGRNANNKQYFDTFSVTNITKSVFDDDDNLTAQNGYIWGQYDLDLDCWKNTSNVNYTYDVNGNVATEETGSKLIEYTYNADNTLAKKDTYIKNKISGNILLQSITYSGFDKFGNPTHAVSTGSYDNNKYDADFEYDADGNELSEYQYQTVDGKQKPLMLKTKKYENGILAEYQESNFDADGNEKPNIKYTYTPVNGDPNVIRYNNFTYTSGEWSEYGRDIYQYYGDFSDKKDGSKTTLTVQKDETLKNTANLIFDIPQLANFQKCKVVIYRDCQAIDTLNISDIISPTISKCVYQDKELKNGSYSYFVQPLFAVNNGGGVGPLVDDPFGDEGDADEPEYEGYYSSSAVEVTFDTELPVVTDLKYVSGQYTPGSIFAEAKYYANIEWKNPSNAADYGFEKNAVYFTDKWNRVSSEAEFTDASVESAQVELTTDVQMQVASFYKYGRVFSDPISVTLKQIESGTTSIETLAGASATIAFNGKNITLSDNANVTVYSANGQQVYSGKNVSSVSLGNMPNGAYIICVEKNGKVNAYKYNAK